MENKEKLQENFLPHISGSSDIWSDVNRRLFETIAITTISRVQLFLSQ